eukprot:2192344-Amphidinium_carterae.2
MPGIKNRLLLVWTLRICLPGTIDTYHLSEYAAHLDMDLVYQLVVFQPACVHALSYPLVLIPVSRNSSPLHRVQFSPLQALVSFTPLSLLLQ